MGALRVLNVAAVGSSLAALSAASLGCFFAARGTMDGTVALTSIVPTLWVGLLWATLLRVRARIGRSRVRWGWAASLPLAMGNAALAAGLFATAWPGEWDWGQFTAGAILGVTVGCVFWVPALVTTLVLFGLPIAWAQTVASKGLSGEERGEIVVGACAFLLAIVALSVAWMHPAGAYGYARDGQRQSLGIELVWVIGSCGAFMGALAAVLALHRELARCRFIAGVGAGHIAGFRVVPSPEGSVLVQLTSISMGEGYRVADITEAKLTLDEHGGVIEGLPDS
jgi:hypothetical protein